MRNLTMTYLKDPHLNDEAVESILDDDIELDRVSELEDIDDVII